MKSEASIKKYIYDWLSNLGIGPVFLDRKPFDDTTKMRSQRTYIVFDFPDGIVDEGPWFRGDCRVSIGCRDQERFVPDMDSLSAACDKFRSEFDRNDDIEGIDCIDVEYIEDYTDNEGNHEFVFVFDMFAYKD